LEPENLGFLSAKLFASTLHVADAIRLVRGENRVDPMGSIARSWAPRGSFHHFGFVVPSIQDIVRSFAESMSSNWDGEIIHDPNQRVHVTFLCGKNPEDPLIELVEPADDGSPVLSFLKRGGGLHHVCYVVDSLDKQLEDCRARHSLVVRPPLPAAAFGERRIAWVYTKNKLLVEYLER
jgi:methylmalonyl-CoA/ethylmalonyl-CoA epimerase